MAIVSGGGGGGTAFPITGAKTIYNDGVDVVSFDASGGFDSNAGAHFAADPAIATGLIIASNGSVTESLDGTTVVAVNTAAGARVINIATTGAGPLLAVSARANSLLMELDSFGGAADAIQYYGPPNFNGEFVVKSDGRITTAGGMATQVITSGALPTVAPVSATAFQCSTTRDVFLLVPVTYNPGVATTATCKVELSPDNVTFSTLITITKPVGTVFDGSIDPVSLVVPAAWRVKLTVTNATLGTGTYY